jgi:dihydroxy-acid dehydratase
MAKIKTGRAWSLRSQFWFNNPTTGMRPRSISSASSIWLPRARSPRPPDHRHRADRLRSSPCNRITQLAERVRDGIRDAGGVAFEFPMHPIQETGSPTAALDRNLAISLVEVLYGYPPTAWCSPLAATRPRRPRSWRQRPQYLATVLGGLMLNGWWKGRAARTIKWAANKRLAAGDQLR